MTELIFTPVTEDAKTASALLDWVGWVVGDYPVEIAEEVAATRRVIASEARLRELVRIAVLRVEIANRDGDPILSAWLKDAKAAIA